MSFVVANQKMQPNKCIFNCTATYNMCCGPTSGDGHTLTFTTCSLEVYNCKNRNNSECI